MRSLIAIYLKRMVYLNHVFFLASSSLSGIVLLNKAEAKIEEIYTVSVNKTSKNDTSPIDGEASAEKTTESEQTEKV